MNIGIHHIQPVRFVDEPFTLSFIPSQRTSLSGLQSAKNVLSAAVPGESFFLNRGRLRRFSAGTSVKCHSSHNCLQCTAWSSPWADCSTGMPLFCPSTGSFLCKQDAPACDQLLRFLTWRKGPFAERRIAFWPLVKPFLVVKTVLVPFWGW